ncbi:MAG: substrate-binding domain-containing protein [Pseudomonadota bacterium]
MPDDLSVVGFDDSSIASTVWPPLTTMRQPVSHMADLAVRALTSNDPPNPSGVTTVPHSFIRRISLGRLPTRKT